MIQGGDPEGTGMGSPWIWNQGRICTEWCQNDLRHTAGVLSMARSMMPDSAGSQFFIMHKDAPHLDGAYAAFGKIIEGQDVVDAIAETATDYSDRPLEDQVMKTVVVDTFRGRISGTGNRVIFRKERQIRKSLPFLTG